MDLKSSAYNPEQTKRLDDLIQKSFSEFVRKERRNLLAASSVSIFVVFGNVVASEAILAGLRFTSMTPKLIHGLLICLVIYSILSFGFYALPEYRAATEAWRLRQQGTAMEIHTSFIPWAIHRDNTITKLRYSVWLTFEYVLPITLGLISIVLLAWRICTRA